MRPGSIIPFDFFKTNNVSLLLGQSHIIEEKLLEIKSRLNKKKILWA